MEITYDPKPLTFGQLRMLSQEVKQALTELYGVGYSVPLHNNLLVDGQFVTVKEEPLHFERSD